MLVTNHTRKAIVLSDENLEKDITLTVGEPVKVPDAVYHKAIASNEALKSLVLSRKLSAQRENKPKTRKSTKKEA